ncbi:hypothetical protein jhhlp_001560 [Lomentospora prolificans]|uniref:Uncharacterized protein n=1 Tax=Lomentospora prolificans TaxID=41688 RepID=A0A2N3NIK7_9PEZI|nr:hypothetical protein jhhlp_001560 [Lomentospora prolificans]
MRLLTTDQNGEFSLTADLLDNIPPYAILSHTWSKNIAEEVTFKDIQDGAWERKAARDKIKFCAEQAGRDGLQYFWVDTCCIDKSTIDEVQTSINSMFRWYRDAAHCYVYLSDVSDQAELPWEDAFRRSKWFTRGWTLQELLAPASVQFFSREGLHLGDKGSLEQAIHSITNIPILALQKTTSLNQFDTDERLRWAEMRKTTREEDWAYCLLGIFGIFMPLNYGEGRDNAISRLRKEVENIPKRQEWLRKLYTCPYRDHKDRNPERVEGTCEWFTNHSLFQDWHQSSAAHLLWVSADPGCGKSVLARYLVDEVLPSTTTRTTCYFFFKEDFENQRSSVTALRSILHQIFDHYPAFFSSQVLEKLQDKGDELLKSFSDLWDILIYAMIGYQKRQVICILDALDECENKERAQLVNAICKFSHSTGSLPLKFLLTSRPYLDIKRHFQRQGCDLSTIHLRGDNDKEIAEITSEIDMVIRRRVTDISQILTLSPKEQDILMEELTRAPNRTYLWVHLIFSELEESFLLTPDKIRSEIRNIPQTVSEAYSRILSKSRDHSLTRKLLHIIMAAVRPLTLYEIALALKIGPECQSIGDIDLIPLERLREDIRHLCGLFVIIVDSKVYLLHQTAREFLVPQSSESPNHSTTTQWGYSFRPRDSHRILAEICIRRLSLQDFDLHNFSKSVDQDQYVATRTLLQYSAQYWASHFREANWVSNDWVVQKAISYCRIASPTSVWFEIYRRSTSGQVPVNFTPLLLASYFGLSSVVERLPKDLDNINAKDRGGWTPLHWASYKGHDTTVQQLLAAGADVNMKDEDRSGQTPLHLASSRGHDTIVQQLLAAGADVNMKDRDGSGWTPLHWASCNGHDTTVQQLLAAGADVNMKNGNGSGWTPLHLASSNGHDTIVQQLLAAGADVNMKDEDGSGWTPLHWASSRGHNTIVQQLLAAGADVNMKDEDGSGQTPLHLASSRGHDTIVQQLLAAGADVNMKDEDRSGWTPLHLASSRGHNTIVQQLLAAGADVNMKDEDGSGRTPLHLASSRGHDTIVQQLLAAGADVNMKDRDGSGWTPLHLASCNGHDTTVQQLLAAGADVNMKHEDGSGWTPLHWASSYGHDTIVQQLLAAGADVNMKDDRSGQTPLHLASSHGHNTAVQQLLAAGADVNMKDEEDGQTPLHLASSRGHNTIVQQLLAAGADVNKKEDRCS